MPDQAIHKVIITGTGRAGTTFLMQLLTSIGLDTGFATSEEGIFDNCNAGMEWRITEPNAPYIIKDPRLCDDLEWVMLTKKFVIDHAFVPIRHIKAATKSRIRVSAQGGLRAKGGLWDTNNPDDQEGILLEKFYALIFTLMKYDIPCTFLSFPRIVKDPEYVYDKMKPVHKGISYSIFFDAFQRISRPELIHSFV